MRNVWNKEGEFTQKEHVFLGLSLYDSKKDKPAEISVLISHSRGSGAHCRLLTGGGRLSVKDGKTDSTSHFASSITFDKIRRNTGRQINKTKEERGEEKKNTTYQSYKRDSHLARHLFISRLTSVPLLSPFHHFVVAESISGFSLSKA